MVELITNPTFRGSKSLADPKQGRAIYTTDLDFSAPEEYQFDFTLLEQAELVGLIKTLYLDNSVNPKAVEITVSQTQQYIVCPPFSVGYFPIIAEVNSRVTLVSEGGATDKCYAAFMNYDVPPVVWSGFAPLVDGAKVTLIGVDGVTNMSATNPIIVGGNNAGSPVSLKVDATGRLEVIGSASGGAVFGPDTPGVAPSQNPLQISGVNAAGNVARQRVNDNGNTLVSGQAAAGTSAPAGDNPIPVGGRVATGSPSWSNGQRAELQFTADGSLITSIGTPSSRVSIASPTDDQATAVAIATRGQNQVFDGSTWDFVRGVTALNTNGIGVQATGMVGIFQTTPPTLTDAQYGRLQLDSGGNLKVAVQTVAINTNVATSYGTGLAAFAVNAFGRVWDGANWQAVRGDTQGLFVKNVAPTTGTGTGPANATSSFTVLASNTARKGATIWNEGATNCFIKLGSGASLTDYSFRLAQDGYYEVPFGYTGIITGISSAATGNLRVTELT